MVRYNVLRMGPDLICFAPHFLVEPCNPPLRSEAPSDPVGYIFIYWYFELVDEVFYLFIFVCFFLL